MRYDYGWRPYVPVAKRRAKAERYLRQLARKGHVASPVEISGRTIARTFWGKAWCDNLESYSDFANRLPRGRTYVRNGSVVDLQIDTGKVTAMVSGSDIYHLTVEIKPLAKKTWQTITQDCSESIDSLFDLLQGRLSDGVMQRLTRQRDGLFPAPPEIQIHCSCPDWAVLCKHAAAVLYGIGARLDEQPELLFRLRAVDHAELIQHAVSQENLSAATDAEGSDDLVAEDLGSLFGIDLETNDPEANDPGATAPSGDASTRRPARKKKKTSAARKKTTRTSSQRGSSTAVKKKQARTTRSKGKVAKAQPALAKATKSAKTKAKATKLAKTKSGATKPARPAKGKAAEASPAGTKSGGDAKSKPPTVKARKKAVKRRK
jgi:uncharacterized Zn finger protein